MLWKGQNSSCGNYVVIDVRVVVMMMVVVVVLVLGVYKDGGGVVGVW